MKLSDAAVMGSTITKLCLGSWSGCFLAAAAKAVGISDFIEGAGADGSRLVSDIRKYWPWLNEGYSDSLYRDYLGHIVRSYDRSEMNFSELIAWVRSVEPDCGECNERVCTCVGLRIEEVPADIQKPLVLGDRWANENVE